MRMGYLRTSTTRLSPRGVRIRPGPAGPVRVPPPSRRAGEATTDGDLGQSSRSKGLELDHTSKFSHVKIYPGNNARTLYFVRDNGDEVVESRVDLDRPDDLLSNTRSSCS